MARDFSENFYKSARWQRCRAAYISYRRSVDGGICERCHEEPGVIVHHKIYLSPDNIGDSNITTGFGNLEYVCQRCHNDEHNAGQDAVDDLVQFRFGENGEIVPIPPTTRKIF